MTPARELEQAVARVDERLRMHAGGIQLVGLSPSGEVRLRFTGMCTGCPYKPLTMASTVRPALARLTGVERVEAEGGRISDEAQARVDSLLLDIVHHPPAEPQR